ncbi:glycoside hydrolase 43 family protein, partial [Rhizobiaceae sp. 2RAB30]
PVPAVEVPEPAQAVSNREPQTVRDDFDGPDLPLDFQWLRTPFPERLFSLTEKPGSLRLFARESIGSWYEQALVARRQQHFSFRAETELVFAPEIFQQSAGLTHYYNRHK